MTAPLLYVWGDDALLAERTVQRFAAALAAESEAPLERWDVRVEVGTAGVVAGQLIERLATPTMFGGGTLAVVQNPGALVRRNDTRDQVIEAIGLMAAGNALAVVEATDPRDMRHGPKVKRLSDAIDRAGGTVQTAAARGPTGLGAWIETEARDRGQALGPGAARELAVRLGARVTEGDVDRRYLTAIAASELDKLALRHALDGEPVTVADVQALVAETTPGSLFALSDAIGERRVEAALAALDRVLDGTAETFLLVILHRRIAELLEIGDRLATGANVATAARAMRIGSSFRAGRLAEQARNWTTAELRDALAGLVELDAMVKGAPGSTADAAQRRLAFVLWVRRHAARSAAGRPAVGAGAGGGRAR